MKVVVFGGAGVIGSFAVQCLARMNTFSQITIADADDQRAQAVVKTSPKIDFIKTDATDEKSLQKSLEGADVAVNCVGPFYKFAPKIMSAAIKKGIGYVDVCDDWDTTATLLDDYQKQAKDAGVTCIVGLGASPGLTNIIAAFGASQMTSVNDIKIFVVRNIEEGGGGAIPYHMMHCFLGKIPIYRNGAYEKAQALVDGEEYVTLPPPYGQVPVWYFGHPETITLPRYIKGVQNVCCKGSYIPQMFRDEIVKVEALGMVSEKPITLPNGVTMKPIDFAAGWIRAIRQRVLETAKPGPAGGSVLVRITGDVNGSPMVFELAGSSDMRSGTGTPAAVGAKMLVEGSIKKPGVYAPEGCIPPQQFIMNFMSIEGFGEVWLSTTQKMTAALLAKTMQR
jgi:saccharopine dehydrogenase-like NADP-dependent oxidoreductase